MVDFNWLSTGKCTPRKNVVPIRRLCRGLAADDDEATTQPAFEAPLQPLQPFSSKYFVQGSGFLTYAADWQATCSALPPSIAPTSTSQSAAPLSRLTEQDLGLLLRHPEEVHFRSHLQLRLDKPPEAAEEDEPFDTPGLQRFVMNQSVLYSDEPAAQLMQLQRQGMLALSGFGHLQQDQHRGVASAGLQIGPMPLGHLSAGGGGFARETAPRTQSPHTLAQRGQVRVPFFGG
mgnify:CR=1 FL=1